MDKPIIKGYYGCYCHSFSSWEECDKAHNQIIKVDQKVKHRCTGKEGIVIGVSTENRKWIIVKYGPLPRDINQDHVAELIKI